MESVERGGARAGREGLREVDVRQWWMAALRKSEEAMVQYQEPI